MVTSAKSSLTFHYGPALSNLPAINNRPLIDLLAPTICIKLLSLADNHLILPLEMMVFIKPLCGTLF